MFERVGRLASSYPKTICLVWLGLGVLLALIAPHWDTRTHDDDIRFIPDRFTSVRAHHILEKAFPNDVFASCIVFAVERKDDTLLAADYALVDRIVHDLKALREAHPELKIGKIEYYKEGIAGPRLTSGDGQCTLIHLCLECPYLALATMQSVARAEETARIAFDKGSPQAGLHLFTTGSAGIGRDLTAVAGNSLEDTTLATILLVVVVLLLVYRAPLLALIPLLTIAVSVWVALNLLALATNLPGVYLVNVSKIFAIVILYGAGTDYCLFLVSRYREELAAGYKTGSAIRRSVRGVGEALAASAATVMVGLALMATAEFAKVRYAGPAIAVSLGVALVASLTLTPALLRLFGKVAFWPGRKPGPVAADPATPRRWSALRLGFWDWMSQKVAQRPALVWCLATAFLLPLVIIGMRIHTDYRATGELSPRCESLQGLAAIQRHFTTGEIGPVTVLLASDVDWNSPHGQLEIQQLSRAIRQQPNVAEVRSLTQPMGLPMPDFLPVVQDGSLRNQFWGAVQPYIDDFFAFMREQAGDRFVGKMEGDAPGHVRYVTRIDVILNSDPFDAQSVETLRRIESLLRADVPRYRFVESAIQTECFGITANMRDLEQVTNSDRRRVNLLVVGAIFLILLGLVRRFWLAVYLLVTVLASYYAALGGTVLAGVFWTGAPLPHVDWRVPFFLFTILVAVGEDYNILLISRAIEERKKYGAVEGMRRALSKTGGAITSCGLIMAGTFATLMLAGLNTMMQVGFALAFGVLIDTFVVRPFLVPAFCILFWKDRKPQGRKQKVSPSEADEPGPHQTLKLQAAEIAEIVDDMTVKKAA